MLIDARTIDDNAFLSADICIIGAGAAGIVLALELGAKSRNVILLESGGLAPDLATQSLYAGDDVGISYAPLDQSRGRYFGGSTNCWGGWCRPLDALDFEERDWVPNSGWPFGRSEIEPYYVRAHEYLQLGPFEYSPAFWEAELGRRKLYTLPLDNKFLTNMICQLSPPARFGALYMSSIKASPNVRALLHANVVELEANETASEVSSVRAQTLTGIGIKVSARHYVLAAGGIENARLLLLSNRVQSAGLGNGRDVVGRYFMDHPRIRSSTVRLSNQRSHRALYDATMTMSLGRSGKRGDRLGAHIAPTPEVQRTMGLTNSRTYLVGRYAYDMSKAYLGLKSVHRLLLSRKRYGHPLNEIARAAVKQIPGLLTHAPRATIGFLDLRVNAEFVRRNFTFETIMEPVPNPDSRVSLSSERDRLGLNRVRLDWRLTQHDERNFETITTLLTDDLVRQGIVAKVSEWPDRNVTGCWHHMGTTRMHKDPAKGVVDAASRVHGISNLYCAGSSVFPTVGSDCPTISLVALALRLADTLACLF